MTQQQLNDFIDLIKADPILAEKVNAAKDAETYVAVAKEAGIDISIDELDVKEVRLSDAELEVGGDTIPTTYPSQPCLNKNTCGPDCKG